MNSSRRSDIQRLGGIVLVMVALRCIAAGTVPMLASEAYYWLWGRYPGLGYIDHPPMAGWMSLIFFGWVEGSLLAARSAPILLGAMTTVVIYVLTRELFKTGRAALLAAAIFSFVPLFDFGCFVIQPDNSLALFCALTWLLFWRAAHAELGDGKSMLLWIATGVTAGLALLSKFHAWILLPPLYLFLMISPPHRAVLKRAGPWLAIIVALIVLSPNLIWNARNDWATYAYQSNRSNLGDSQFTPKYFFVYVLSPFLTLTPFVYAGMLAAIYKAVRYWRNDPAVLYLLLAGLPLPLFLGVLSTRVSISMHWAATAYIPLVILFAMLLERGEIYGRRGRRIMWGTVLVMLTILHLVPVIVHALPAGVRLPYRAREINTSRLREDFNGWWEVGARVREIRNEMNRQKPTVIMTRDSHLSSQMAFYSELPRECFTLFESDSHHFKYWRADRGDLIGYDAVVVATKPGLKPPYAEAAGRRAKMHIMLNKRFEKVEEEPSIFCFADGTAGPVTGPDDPRKRIKEFMIFRCYGYKGPNIFRPPSRGAETD